MNVYEKCPVVQNERFQLRPVKKEDCVDLLRVYSDPKAVAFFNSDNCHGDDFHYQTAERMAQAVDFWVDSYAHEYFVRWSIQDLQKKEIVGTIELFHRDAEDAFTNTGLLRLDLRSDYEQEDAIFSILSLIVNPAYEWFDCASITTKAVAQAQARRAALARMGFEKSSEKLIGHDGTAYGDYFVCRKNA